MFSKSEIKCASVGMVAPIHPCMEGWHCPSLHSGFTARTLPMRILFLLRNLPTRPQIRGKAFNYLTSKNKMTLLLIKIESSQNFSKSYRELINPRFPPQNEIICSRILYFSVTNLDFVLSTSTPSILLKI